MNIDQSNEYLQKLSELGKDTSPLADLVGAADTARRSDLTDYFTSVAAKLPAKADPFGEFADVQPITIRNAGLVLREATKRLEAARLTHKSASEAVQETNRAYGEAIEAHRKAEHLLMISALQPNGGEA